MRTRTQRLMAWSVMSALLLASVPLPAKERKGAQVVVQRKDGSSVSGELLMVKRDCLVVGEKAGGELVSLGEIGSVRIKKKSKAGTGFLLGLLGGTLMIYAVSRDAHSCNPREMDFAMSALFVGLPAGGLGALIGLGAGKDSILKMDEMELGDLLGKLNRQARTPDAALSTGQK